MLHLIVKEDWENKQRKLLVSNSTPNVKILTIKGMVLPFQN